VICNTSSDYSEEERKRKLDRFRAAKSKLVRASEYTEAGKVLVFNKRKSIADFPGKFGSVMQYTVYDPDLGVERIVNASALSYVDAVEAKLAEKPAGTDVKLRIKKTGNGSDARYGAEFVN
jgi:hypothetical protein